MSKFLNEYDASKLLSPYGIAMTKSFICTSKNEVLEICDELQYPVVMKVLSEDIQHKTDAGCVFLNIGSAENAEIAYNRIYENANTYNPTAKIDGVLVQEMAKKGLEVIIGTKNDPQFGPVIMVGTGGIYVEVFKDISFRLMPLSRLDAIEMIKETSLFKIINGARGLKYDLDELVDTILKISKLIEDNPQIEEIDINPFFLYEEGNGGKGVDALIKVKS